MRSTWNWVSNQYNSIKDSVSNRYYSIKNSVVETYSSITSTISYITEIPDLQQFAYSFSIKWWEGFTRVLDPTNVTKILFHSKKTRAALKESFKANVVYYLSFAMFAEYVVSAITSEDDQSWISLSNAINMTVNIGLGTILVHRLFDNTLINLTLSKNVIEENPIGVQYKYCGCDDGALISAGVFSSVNLMGKKISIAMLSNEPVIGYIAPIANIFADGETLAEFPYSAAGMCTMHRAESLVKDNAYSFGIGCSLYAVSKLISSIIYSQTGLSSFFISNAINSALYPYFISSVLLREKAIPGDKQGIDFFYYHRFLLQNMSKSVGNQIMPLLQGKTEAPKWKMKLERIADSKPLHLAKWIYSRDIYSDWSSLQTIQVNPSTILFFNEYYLLIKQQLDNIFEIRDKSYVGKFVPVLPDAVKYFLLSEDNNNLLSIILNKNLGGPLKKISDLVDDTNKKHNRIKDAAKIRILDKSKFEECLNRELGIQKSNSIEKPVVAEQKLIELPSKPIIIEKKEEVVVEKKEEVLAKEKIEDGKVVGEAPKSGLAELGIFSEPAKQPVEEKPPVKSHSRKHGLVIMDEYESEPIRTSSLSLSTRKK